MDQAESIWLNPIIELPIPVAVLVLVGILFSCFYSPRAAILVLLLTVPLQRFIVIPGILGNRFTPHEAAFLSYFAAVISRWRSQIRLTFPWSGPLGVPVLLLLAVGVMSLLGNPFVDLGISELVILGYLFLLMHLISDLSTDPDFGLHVFRSWYITCAGFCLLAMGGGLAQYLGIDTFLMGGPRLIVTFFNPNQAGSFIIAGVFLFLTRASNPQTPFARKLLNLGLVFCSIGGAYFMQSRATVLGGLTGLAVFLVLRRARVSAIAGIGILLLAGSAALSMFQKSSEDQARIYDNRYSEGVDPESHSAQARIENWQMGFDAFARSPAIGVGIGTLWMQAPPTSGESYQVHNTYLSFLAETGGVGFLLLLIIIVIIVRECVAGMRLARGTRFEDPLVALIPALAAMGVFNVFHYGVRARHLWVTIGLVMVFRRLARDHAAQAADAAPEAAPAPPTDQVPHFAKESPVA
jgi:O-antigen ligase